MNFETISIIGLGYIGLPTAAVFSSHKKKVIGVDVNQQAVDIINQGKIHIVEPDLEGIVDKAIKEGYLLAVTKPKPADVFLICVPTPIKENKEPDLSYIKSASQSIAPVLKQGDLVILESTSPVGTTEQMVQWLAVARPDLTFPISHGENSDIRIAYCPERILPGHVLRELVQNDRVIGGITPKCSEMATKLYKIFVEGECVITDARTAEMCKLTENAFRDVNIAFANELSIISDKLNINVWELIQLANRHPRVNILQPGPGVGGHCIAVDPWFIVSSSPENAQLIRTAREINDRKPDYILEKVLKMSKGVAKPVIACLGLSFKPDVDDLRESPAIEIVQKLATMAIGRLLVVEPNVNKLPLCLQNFKNIEFISLEEAIKNANIVLMLVSHQQFFKVTKDQLANKSVIDTKGIW